MSKWVNQIAEAIKRKKIFKQGERILIAVSGGLDSMVLLNVLHQLTEQNQWRIAVAHFNHQLRGKSSLADEKLVERTAKRLKLKFNVGRRDVKAFGKRNRLSIEMAARKLRHEFLARTAKRCRIKTVVLAHHADDQVELFFLRLLRGAGPEGLAGMGWESPSPADSSIRLVRPLLGQNKESLREYAETHRIPFREDSSNALPDFQRNRIRNELIPLLESMQPAAKETILRTMEIGARESNFVRGAALEWLSGKQRPPLGRLHVAVQRACLRLEVRALGFSGDFDLIEKLRREPNRAVSADSRWFLWRDVEGRVFRQTAEAKGAGQAQIHIDLSGRKVVNFGGRKITWAVEHRKGASFRRRANREFFDAGKVGQCISLRHWKPGDRFQPIGMKTAVKLQNLFINLKIPRAERHRRIVAVTAAGDLFWVEGLRISERFKLDKNSLRRLKWVWQCFDAPFAGAVNPC